VSPFVSDCRPHSVAGIDCRRVRQAEQSAADALDQLLHIAAGEIGPADPIGKERIPCKDKTFLLGVETYPTRGMAGSVENLQSHAGLPDRVSIFEKNVGRLSRKGVARED